MRWGSAAIVWWHIARDLLSLGHQDSRVGEVQKLPENKPSFLTGRGNATRLSLEGLGGEHSAKGDKTVRTVSLPPPHTSRSCLEL